MNELKYKEMIYKKAEQVKTKTELSDLLDEITDFKHDYGTIVYGCMAAMNAAFNVVNKSESGGITGFQAGFLGWECVHKYMMIKGPCKIVDYNNLLYPQYQDKFEKVISQEAWEHLQQKAKEFLDKKENATPKVVEHWKKIVSGEVPFGFRVGEQ